ncbi:hypothetical protein RSAG8_13422, partial [Rhizoctonia solani AG-8 WAC10335]
MPTISSGYGILRFVSLRQLTICLIFGYADNFFRLWHLTICLFAATNHLSHFRYLTTRSIYGDYPPWNIELYSYLRSPFRDLPAYDAVVQYDTPDNIEAPPPTAPRSSRQNEVGPSRSRRDSDSRRYDSDTRARNGSNTRGRYEPDDPLDASPRDADSNSEMDMDEHWIEAPPSRRGGSRRDSPGVGTGSCRGGIAKMIEATGDTRQIDIERGLGKKVGGTGGTGPRRGIDHYRRRGNETYQHGRLCREKEFQHEGMIRTYHETRNPKGMTGRGHPPLRGTGKESDGQTTMGDGIGGRMTMRIGDKGVAGKGREGLAVLGEGMTVTNECRRKVTKGGGGKVTRGAQHFETTKEKLTDASRKITGRLLDAMKNTNLAPTRINDQ